MVVDLRVLLFTWCTAFARLVCSADSAFAHACRYPVRTGVERCLPPTAYRIPRLITTRCTFADIAVYPRPLPTDAIALLRWPLVVVPVGVVIPDVLPALTDRCIAVRLSARSTFPTDSWCCHP